MISFRTVALMLMPCATVAFADHPATYPQRWEPVKREQSCIDINGRYRYRGDAGSEAFSPPPLAIALFLPGIEGWEPDAIDVTFVPEGGEIRLSRSRSAIAGDVQEVPSVRVPAQCIDNHVIVQQSKSYTSDGVPVRVENRAEFWITTDNALVAHVREHHWSKFLFIFTFGEHDTAEWYKFARVS